MIHSVSIDFNRSLEKNISDEKKILIELMGKATIDSALLEMKEQEQGISPYNAIRKIDGLCFDWNEDFLLKIIVALATDSLESFTANELQIWNNFVSFQERHSMSANSIDIKGTAIGTNGTYIVAKDPEDRDGQRISSQGWIETIVTKELAHMPEGGVEKAYIWKSLDRILVDLVNCKEPSKCIENTIFGRVYDCVLKKPIKI